MTERMEGPIERKFWTAVMWLAFGPISISFALYILGWVVGEGDEALHLASPVFFFGMMMVGIGIVGATLRMLAAGQRMSWFALVMGSAWLLYFGRYFIRIIAF